MLVLKGTLYRQGQTIEDMQNIIEKQEAKLNEQDHVIKMITDKLANTDKIVTELKSEISMLKKDVAYKELQLSKQVQDLKINETETRTVKPVGNHKPLTEKKKHDNHSTGETEKNKTSQETMADFQKYDKKRQIFQTTPTFPSATPGLATRTPAVANRVAFTTYLGHNVNHMVSGHTIKCDQVLLNDGNSYSPFTGEFTAPISGVYLLTFNIALYDVNMKTSVKLVKNNVNIVDASVQSLGSSHDEMGGNTAILRLDQGDAVWLKNDGAEGEARSHIAYRFTTFSGVLLYT